MPKVSNQELSAPLRLGAVHRGTPQGARDLDGVTAMLGKFSGDLPALIGPAMERYLKHEVKDIQDILCASFRCETLRPGDFTAQVFENLTGFQSLMRACGAEGLNAAARLCVLSRCDYKDATPEDKETPAALIVVRIYPPQKYNDSYLDISRDATMGMPSQFWSPKNIALPADAPAAPTKLMKPLRLKVGRHA